MLAALEAQSQPVDCQGSPQPKWIRKAVYVSSILLSIVIVLSRFRNASSWKFVVTNSSLPRMFHIHETYLFLPRRNDKV